MRWTLRAQQLSKPYESLLPRMRLAIQSKQHIEIARQQCRRSMIQTHQIAPLDRQLHLMNVRRHVLTQNRKILRDDCRPQLLRIRLPRPLLQRRKPSHSIKQNFRMQHVVPKTSRVPDRCLIMLQRSIELLLDPQTIPKHHVRRDSGCLIDPFIARLPDFIANLSSLSASRHPSPLYDGNWLVRIDI